MPARAFGFLISVIFQTPDLCISQDSRSSLSLLFELAFSTTAAAAGEMGWGWGGHHLATARWRMKARFPI